MSPYHEKELSKFDELKKVTARLFASQKRFAQLSEKRSAMSIDTHTPNQIGKANADLDWHAMDHDKLMHEAHAIAVDCGLAAPRDNYEPVEYRPTGFHHYRHQPRRPLCRQ